MSRPSGPNLHVVLRNDGWAVRAEGRSRATSIHKSQREAIDSARQLAQQTTTTVVIHGRDGRIKERTSYVPNPRAPREPRRVPYPSGSPNTNREAIRKAVGEAVREISEEKSLALKAS